MWQHFLSDLPELTVMASTNWSLQLLVPIKRAKLVFFMSLSTVLWWVKIITTRLAILKGFNGYS